ncbi:unnamed protein product [Gordionus sp. m RMFG-2023]|uniref:pre-rRNA-processing protein TSR2 homolog n=1 Tax=Gordionus sp. m RMFG-2023 TaxID=3053472 RepID=UPI0030E525B2
MDLKQSYNEIYSKWPSLKIAIENNEKGIRYQEFVKWLSNVTFELMEGNRNIQSTEIEDYLIEIIDNELDTYIEDDTLIQVSQDIYFVYELYCKKKYDEIKLFLLNIPTPCDLTATTISEDSSHEESTDDITAIQNNNNQSMLYKNDSQENLITAQSKEDLDEEWITIGPKYKNLYRKN